MIGFDVMASICAMLFAAASAYLARKIVRDSRHEIAKLHCRLTEAEHDVILERNMARQRHDADMEKINALQEQLDEATRAIEATQIEYDEDEISIMGLTVRRGNAEMAKVSNASGKLVASLSQAYLYKTFGIDKEEYDGLIVDIFIHKNFRNYGLCRKADRSVKKQNQEKK